LPLSLDQIDELLLKQLNTIREKVKTNRR